MPTITQSERWRWLFIAIVCLGLWMRVTRLAERPLHHDESIHATFSYQWDESPDHSYYKYDPTYHGPFLYAVTRWFFPLFGVGVAQARLFPLLFGILVLFTPFFFEPWLGPFATRLAVAILAVSPLATYYSRFLAHDMPAVFFAACAAGCGLYWLRAKEQDDQEKERLWLCLGAAALGLLYSVKAVCFLYTFIYLTFLVLVWAEAGFERPAIDKSRLSVWFLALTWFLTAYAVFQTSLFHNPQGFIDGLFGRVFSYWWGQHTIERVVGPVTFHLRSFLLHELPVTLILLVGMTAIVRRAKGGLYWLESLLVFAIVVIAWPLGLKEHFPAFAPLFSTLKLKSSPDLFLYLMAFVFGILGSWRLLREGKRFTAFLVYWTFSSLAIYSFVGEKAPWLTIHIVFPAVLLAASLVAYVWPAVVARAEEAPWKRQAAVGLALLALCYQARLTYYVTFVTAGEPSDLLSQVHNTKDVKFVVDWMKRVALETGERDEGLPIAIVGSPTWAFYFYLIEGGFKKFALEASQVDGSQRFVITDDDGMKQFGKKLLDLGYRLTKLTHSGWWVPEYNTVTWRDWVHYALTRKPAGSIGTTPLFVYFKPLPIPPTVPLTSSRPALASEKK